MDALVSWTPNSEPDVLQYHVWHGYVPGDYVDVQVVMHPTAQKSYTGLDDFKQHYFAVTAVDNAMNESDYSSVVSKRVPHRFTMK